MRNKTFFSEYTRHVFIPRERNTCVVGANGKLNWRSPCPPIQASAVLPASIFFNYTTEFACVRPVSVSALCLIRSFYRRARNSPRNWLIEASRTRNSRDKRTMPCGPWRSPSTRPRSSWIERTRAWRVTRTWGRTSLTVCWGNWSCYTLSEFRWVGTVDG